MNTLRNIVSVAKSFLIAYVTLGDPDPKLSLDIANALIEGGADILELGIPAKNPKYDGPLIRASYKRASEAGVDLKKALRLAEKIKGVPKIILSYYDSIRPLSLSEFAEGSAAAGADAILIPDLLVDHLELLDECVATVKATRLELIFFIPSILPYHLIERVDALKPTMIYLGLMPATWIQLPTDPIGAISRIRSHVGRLPLAVGFAIYEPEQVAQYLQAGANGVVVGSSFAKIIESERTEPERMLKNLRSLAARFKEKIG